MCLIRMQLVLVAHTRPTVLTRNSPRNSTKEKGNHHGQYRSYLKGIKASNTSNWIEFGGKSTPEPNQKPPLFTPATLKHRSSCTALSVSRGSWGEGRRDPSSWDTVLVCRSLPSAEQCVLSQQLPLLPKFTLGALCFSNHKYTTCWTCCCVEGESTGRRD